MSELRIALHLGLDPIWPQMVKHEVGLVEPILSEPPISPSAPRKR